ncbi:MAG: S-layer homology domain-containing protein [Candidatus Limnocylindria bacterium]
MLPRPDLRHALLPASLSGLLSIALLLSVAVTPVAGVPASQLVIVANGYRADAGLPLVSVHDAVQQIASERADHMAATGDFSHDFDYVTRRFDELGVCWQGYGEIIAWHSGTPQPDYQRFGQQWYNSATHRAIMLGNYDVAGGGVATADDDRHYGAMVWVHLCEGTGPTVGGFSDVPASSPFGADIEWLVESGITAGCSAGAFCPTAAVTRDQMASFLARGLGLDTANGDFFTDDAGSVHEPDINRVANANVTSGCTASLYCPQWVVTRGQMAAFLVRALALPAAEGDYFADDEANPFEDAINRLAASGITGGCAAERYCPDGSVTREQMAAFLHRAFGS